MKKFSILAVLCALALSLTAQATTWTVDVHNFAFVPANLTIAHGDTVHWHASNGFHSVHHNVPSPLFGRPAASAPWDYSFVFNNSGDSTFHYLCEVHPSLMLGTITVTPPTPSTVTVTSPDGGENWTVGTSQAISWTSTNLSANVKIELNRSYPSASWETLFASIPNVSPQSWTVSGAPSSACRVRITSVLSASVSDTSNADFTISAAPSITVTEPNGGDVWYAGTLQTIMWTSTNVTGDVMIELQRGYPFGTWETLFADVANSGSQTFTITGLALDSCRVRVTSIAAPSVSDTSDADFAIRALGSPQGLAIYSQGNDAVLIWEPTAGADGYNVYRSTNVSVPVFSDLVGSTTDTTLTDTAYIATHLKTFYQVTATRAAGSPLRATR